MESKNRILSIDVLRGLTVALMITVNNPGSWAAIYPPLRHAAWSGCTPTDLVFPFFMFIVGCSMWFVFSRAGHGFTAMGPKVFKRTILIFLVGFLLNWYPFFRFPIEMTEHSFFGIEFQAPSVRSLSNLRIMGVLQRIALAYGLASVLILSMKKTKPILIFCGLILFGYWAVLYLFSNGENYMDAAGSAAQRLDVFLLGENHLYKGFGVPFDPEGLLAALPALVNVVLGYFAGKIIGTTQNKIDTVKKLLLFGFIGIISGLIWNFGFPINKPLWTSSFVLYTCGWASALLGMCIFIIDVKGFKAWTKPFLVFGMNPLFIFVLAGVVAKTLPLIKVNFDGNQVGLGTYWYKAVITPFAEIFSADPRFSSLMYALSYIIVFWAIGYVLYKRKIFIKL